MTSVSAATVRNATDEACQPASESGIRSFQTARQLKTKLKSAFAPVQPPNAQRRRLNAAKKQNPQPIRQWSRATRISSGGQSFGTMTSAVSPTANFLSSSICARSSFAEARTEPSARRTRRRCVPNSRSPCRARPESSVSTTSARTARAPSSARRRGPGRSQRPAQAATSATIGSALRTASPYR